MFGVGTGELLVVALVALIVLGPDKLPEAARKAGRLITELRRMSSGFQSELRDALQDPVEGPPASRRSPTPKAPPAPSTAPDGEPGENDVPDPAAGLAAEVDPTVEGVADHLDGVSSNGHTGAGDGSEPGGPPPPDPTS